MVDKGLGTGSPGWAGDFRFPRKLGNLVSEEHAVNYQDRLTANLWWYRQQFTETRLATADGRTIRFSCRRQNKSRALVIIVNGRTEFIEKYIEVLRDLQLDGISYALYDHCGQGDSDRLLSDPEKGHIDRFYRYVDDLEKVVQACRSLFGSIPIHLLCHSMGGTIAWLYCADHPAAVASMILSAPMFAIQTGVSIPLFMVESIARFCCRNGMADRYVVTTGPYDRDPPFEDNELTADPDRFAFNVFMTGSLPFAPIGGPTYGWLCEAFSAMRRCRRVIGRIDCPVYFLVGSEDRVVGIDSIEQIAAEVHGLYQAFKHGRHELMMETPMLRQRVLELMREILEGRVRGI